MLLDVARNFAEVILLVIIADMFNGVYISHGYILTSIFIYVLYHIYIYIYFYIYIYTILYYIIFIFIFRFIFRFILYIWDGDYPL